MPPDYLIRVTVSNGEKIAIHPIGQAQPDMVDSKPPVAVERLIRAKNQARAIGHVVKDSIVATVAETYDVIRLTAAGVKLEQAE